jgi:hypothetical protein
LQLNPGWYLSAVAQVVGKQKNIPPPQGSWLDAVGTPIAVQQKLMRHRIDGGSEWGSNPPVTGLPAARRF